MNSLRIDGIFTRLIKNLPAIAIFLIGSRKGGFIKAVYDDIGRDASKGTKRTITKDIFGNMILEKR